MAVVAISDSILTDIADAIRSKNGQETLYKPSEMPDAIEAISGGGITPTGTKEISITENGTTTEDVTNYANAEISVSVPNSYVASDEGKVVSNGALVAQTSDTVTSNDTYDTTLINSLTVNVSGGNPNENLLKLATDTLTSVVLDVDGAKVKERLFNTAKSLLTARLLNIGESNSSQSGQYIFYNCTNLQKVVLTGKGINVPIPSYTLGSCSSVTEADITNLTLNSGSAFNGASSLNVLVIRNSSVATLGNINVFTNTPFASGKAGGILYVPNNLISSYQSASNWATILGYANNQIKKIEGTTYESYYVDGTPIS